MNPPGSGRSENNREGSTAPDLPANFLFIPITGLLQSTAFAMASGRWITPGRNR